MQSICYKIFFLFVLIFVFFAFKLRSQENPIKSVNQSTMVGVGQSFLNETYLSPLQYKGFTTSILSERINSTRFFDNKVIFQQKFNLQVAFTKNPSASANEYYGNVSYNANMLYPFYNKHNLKLYAGGGTEAALGGIYNQRNSNNPGSLKTSLNLNISAMATYGWSNMTFRWQLTSPFAGLFFSPAYGQSYYEIFMLGNGAGTILFGSFFNQLALQNYLTVDIPVKNITIRTGYLGNYYKTDVNSIITKIDSHQFMLGLAVESINFGGKKQQSNKLIKSSFY